MAWTSTIPSVIASSTRHEIVDPAGANVAGMRFSSKAEAASIRRQMLALPGVAATRIATVLVETTRTILTGDE